MALGGTTSEHPGGVNVLFADGSVNFISDSISSWNVDGGGFPNGSTLTTGRVYLNLPTPGIWQAMATRVGGESISP